MHLSLAIGPPPHLTAEKLAQLYLLFICDRSTGNYCYGRRMSSRAKSGAGTTNGKRPAAGPTAPSIPP